MKNFPKTLGNRFYNLDDSKLLLAFKKTIKKEAIEKQLKKLDLKILSLENRNEKNETLEVNHTDSRYWVTSLSGKAIDEETYNNLLKDFKKDLDFVGPVYFETSNNRGQNSSVCPLPSVILINKKMFSDKEFLSRIEKYKLQLNKEKSKYLSTFNLLELPDSFKLNSYQISNELKLKPNDFHFEKMPMIRDFCAIPNDPLFGNQWNMTQINAPNAWDITTGVNTVLVSVIDSGVDLTHPDLQLSGVGIDLGDMISDGSPNNFGGNTGHGTCCSGIVAATFNNSLGVTGVAGNCQVIPVAINSFSDVEIANGVNWSVSQGASVISMSFTIPSSALVDTEFNNAILAGVNLCAATGNGNSTSIGYPSINPQVMACGASSTDDNRKTTTSPDGENWWGSDYGDTMYGGQQTGVSVVAPGVLIPTTDIQGTGGYNGSAGVGGNYFQTFNGTSSATPLVAGCLALVKSQYPGLSAIQVRNIIEKTAAKVGTLAYSEVGGFSNGTRNQEMGYGRIDIFQALDFADVMIKDWAGDNGTEPSSPPSGNFWSFSDIVVRITDDNVFNPSNPSQSKHVERGQTNFIYVRVTNKGLREARNVAVNIRITPYIGLQFVHPNDWTLIDAMHVNPLSIINNFPTIPAGGDVIAKFSISSTQVEDLYGWQTSNPWHPCLLAEVSSDNDYAYTSSDLSFGNIVVRKNNFAQRNLSVIDVFASATMAFPFVAGSLFKKQETIRLVIDRSLIPNAVNMRLRLDNNEKMIPGVDFNQTGFVEEDDCNKIVVHNESHLGVKICGCDVKFVLNKGSEIYLNCKKESSKLKLIEHNGGKRMQKNGTNYLTLDNQKSLMTFEISPQSIHALAVELDFPDQLEKDGEYMLSVYQIGQDNAILGGASVIYLAKE